MNGTYDKNVGSLMFFHIPMEDYQEAYDLYKALDPAVTYYFGEIGEADEAISSSDYENNLFKAAVDLQSTKAMFVGRDYYNTISLEYQGIRLTYGMSIDYLVMPDITESTYQRGATLITVQEDSSFEIEQIPLVDVE